MPDIIQQFDEQALVWIAENVRCALLDPFMKLYILLGKKKFDEVSYCFVCEVIQQSALLG